MKWIKAYPELHQKGWFSLEAAIVNQQQADPLAERDFGIQIAEDGRIWICIDGAPFIRFKPKRGDVMELSKLFPMILEDASPRLDDTSLADRIELFGFVDLGSLRLAAYRYRALGLVWVLGNIEWLPESEFRDQFRDYKKVSE